MGTEFWVVVAIWAGTLAVALTGDRYTRRGDLRTAGRYLRVALALYAAGWAVYAIWAI